MKRLNLLLLVTILGSNMLGLGVSPNHIEKKFADTRAANVTTYTTTKKIMF